MDTNKNTTSFITIISILVITLALAGCGGESGDLFGPLPQGGNDAGGAAGAGGGAGGVGGEAGAGGAAYSCDADPNLGADCSNGVGLCKAEGKMVCNASQDGLECDAEEGLPDPLGEICSNELDDDCDETTDEQECTVLGGCSPGDPGTVDEITTHGGALMRLLVHYGDGSEEYFTTNPTTVALTKQLPGHTVLLGRDIIGFILKNNSNPASKPYYLVDMNSLPGACNGVNIETQACLTEVGKSWRCQFGTDTVGCPNPAVNFSYTGETSAWNLSSSGDLMLINDLNCP